MLKRYLTEDEQRRLLTVVKGQAGLLAQRDYAWIRLLIETGMRINELATLSYRQAADALATGWLVVNKEQRKGKRKGQEYLVTEPVRQCLVKLMELQEELRPLGAVSEGAPPLIWGRCGVVGGRLLGENMSVRSFQARMKHWGYLAGLPAGVSPHWLRHTRGVNIVRRSRGRNPLKVVQEALGHASIASTGIYTQLTREEYANELRTVASGRMRKVDARAAASAGGVL
ncbi:XerC Site-specific recombinase XerC [Comamonadaceae bacterium]